MAHSSPRGQDQVLFCHDGEGVSPRSVLPRHSSLADLAPYITSVASSDATNIRTSIVRDGDSVIVNGSKWWISGSGDPRTKLHLVMGKSDPNNANPHKQQSIVIIPADAPGVKIGRPMMVFGWDDAPEGESAKAAFRLCSCFAFADPL